ncbi:2-phosphosulfolactate phosphatase [Natronogracilivirga saccharolytica]|uniref:Probable 2-phosphosulfolactate phosphatase n=1 Tax=Natronogracilivirga saccharolytica TaxID=2812953 RepID=A0A8J7RRC3_9BACT|nr:2-phosphosulfolactate phosphatase [Natronogracilivirga saccharolytica]MBP3191547.1 2-phosphosulfolactate phosphatase [Natronogracilivirga saccharolytica]
MNNNIDVYSSSVAFTEDDVRDKTVVVIDVLRACSTIQAALENGAAGVIPVAENDDAGKYTRSLDASRILLCGEKGGKKIEGYRLGNSPLEYVYDIVNAKIIILKTTNGTRAVTRSSNAKEVLIASFLNLTAVVDYLKKQNTRDVLLICSGWNNRLSIEDMLCAGTLTYRLFDGKLPADATDGTKVAFSLYQKFGENISKLIDSSNHAKRLKAIGYEKDIDFCSQVDLYSSVPVLYQGMIRLN